jgi:hypothetical protein
MKHLILIITLIFGISVFAQQSNFNTQRNWSKNKKELLFGFGGTQFLGDLGGRDQEGTDYSLVDMDFKSTSLNLFGGYRFRWSPFWSTRSQLSIGLVRGSDELTQDIVRNSRNLHFRSPIVDFQQRIEFILFANEKMGARYLLAGTNRTRMYEKNNQFYLFTGIGVTYFNPQARYNGSWVNLRPLSTEGQGLAGGPKKYLPVTATIPFGFGYRWAIEEQWRLGFEATYVKTFTDYMDDVSGTYYDPSLLGSPAAQYLSNPSNQNQSWFQPGEIRGHEEKDAYFYLNFVVYKNITYKSYAKRNKMKGFKGAKAKF